MSEPKYGLVAVGNALVDVLTLAGEDFIAAQEKSHGMKRGAMSLIEEARATELYAAMGPGVEVSGGSAGNTMAGFASFGGKGAYIGKVADDQLGAVFRHDMQAQGVDFVTPPLAGGPATGRCLILVTPDGQRTMNTYLGAATELGPQDINPDVVASARITYLEGYLYDKDQAKSAFKYAAEIAHDAGHKVALTLSDPFCVGRHRDDFHYLVENHVDILFANEEEIKALYQTASFDDAIAKVSGHCEVAVVTRGSKGALVIAAGRQIAVRAEPVDRVVDTTGAGDQYAAGFLYGYVSALPLEICGRLGALAAREVIGHMGPRPETKYADLLKVMPGLKLTPAA